MSCLLGKRFGSLKTCTFGPQIGAKIAQLGERMTEDHKVRCSIHLLGAFFFLFSPSKPTERRTPYSFHFSARIYKSHNC